MAKYNYILGPDDYARKEALRLFKARHGTIRSYEVLCRLAELMKLRGVKDKDTRFARTDRNADGSVSRTATILASQILIAVSNGWQMLSGAKAGPLHDRKDGEG